MCSPFPHSPYQCDKGNLVGQHSFMGFLGVWYNPVDSQTKASSGFVCKLRCWLLQASTSHKDPAAEQAHFPGEFFLTALILNILAQHCLWPWKSISKESNRIFFLPAVGTWEGIANVLGAAVIRRFWLRERVLGQVQTVYSSQAFASGGTEHRAQTLHPVRAKLFFLELLCYSLWALLSTRVWSPKWTKSPGYHQTSLW